MVVPIDTLSKSYNCKYLQFSNGNFYQLQLLWGVTTFENDIDNYNVSHNTSRYDFVITIRYL